MSNVLNRVMNTLSYWVRNSKVYPDHSKSILTPSNFLYPMFEHIMVDGTKSYQNMEVNYVEH